MFKQILPLILVLLVSISVLAFLQNKILNNNDEKREERLQKIHTDATNQFQRSIENFAALMSGMRSYINQSERFPSQYELQYFVSDQLDQMNFQDSLVVSYLNKDHEFIYSFTKDKINPSGLIGKSVYQFRDTAAINRLNKLLKTDRIKVFPPINLFEGWVGIPINFRVEINGSIKGYVAALINFRSITTPIDRLVDSKDFVLKFEVPNGSEFDRDQVFNGFEVYHERMDTLSSRYVSIPENEWLSSSINLFGQDFTISTSYRTQTSLNKDLKFVFTFFYLLILVFSLMSIRKSWQAYVINNQLSFLNDKMSDQNIELQALNTTKDRFFSIIGHDLRGPLATIISLMEIINSKTVSLQESEILLSKLTPAAKNAINLLEDLLKWAQINNNEIRLNLEKTNVGKLIKSSLDLVATNAELKGIKLTQNIDALDDIVIDKNMISTVIRNLVSNSIKFSNSGSEIIIQSYLEEKNWILLIKDQGVGMSQKKINEINNSKHSSSDGTAGEKGSGLGLTICIAFIKKHNGTLEVESEKNKGSQFRVAIPIQN